MSELTPPSSTHNTPDRRLPTRQRTTDHMEIDPALSDSPSASDVSDVDMSPVGAAIELESEGNQAGQDFEQVIDRRLDASPTG